LDFGDFMDFVIVYYGFQFWGFDGFCHIVEISRKKKKNFEMDFGDFMDFVILLKYLVSLKGFVLPIGFQA
jgi:hypothetical protein